MLKNIYYLLTIFFGCCSETRARFDAITKDVAAAIDRSRQEVFEERKNAMKSPANFCAHLSRSVKKFEDLVNLSGLSGNETTIRTLKSHIKHFEGFAGSDWESIPYDQEKSLEFIKAHKEMIDFFRSQAGDLCSVFDNKFRISNYRLLGIRFPDLKRKDRKYRNSETCKHINILLCFGIPKDERLEHKKAIEIERDKFATWVQGLDEARMAKYAKDINLVAGILNRALILF